MTDTSDKTVPLRALSAAPPPEGTELTATAGNGPTVWIAVMVVWMSAASAAVGIAALTPPGVLAGWQLMLVLIADFIAAGTATQFLATE